MKSPVVAIVGKIASGKTTISHFIANTFGWSWTSFGAYVRVEAHNRGLNDSRAALQQLGDILLAENIEQFCRAVLTNTGWVPGQPLLIDGIRHVKVVHTLQSLIVPQRLVIVHIDVPEDVRLRRLVERGVHLGDQKRREDHPSEIQVGTVLPTLADIVLDGTQPPYILVNRLFNELQRRGFIEQIPEAALPIPQPM